MISYMSITNPCMTSQLYKHSENNDLKYNTLCGKIIVAALSQDYSLNCPQWMHIHI